MGAVLCRDLITCCCKDKEEAEASRRSVLSDRHKKHLDQACSVLINNFASEYNDTVVRIFLAELVKAIELISLLPPQVDSLSDPRSYVEEVVTAADKDAFVMVEQTNMRGKRRMGVDDFLADNVNSDSFNVGSSSANKRGGGGTLHDGVAMTTSSPLLTLAKKRKKNNNEGEEQDAIDENIDDDDDENQQNTNSKTRMLKIWEEASNLVVQRYFRPNSDRVQLLKSWILSDKSYSGKMLVDHVRAMLSITLVAAPSSSLSSSSSSAMKSSKIHYHSSGNNAMNSSRSQQLLAAQIANTSFSSFQQAGNNSSNAAKNTTTTTTQDNSDNSSTKNENFSSSDNLLCDIHQELAEQLKTQLSRIQKRLVDAKNQITFADLWEMHEELTFDTLKEFDVFWDIVSTPAKKRLQLELEAEEKIVAEEKIQRKKDKLRKKKLESERRGEIWNEKELLEDIEQEEEKEENERELRKLQENLENASSSNKRKKTKTGIFGTAEKTLTSSSVIIANEITKNDLANFLIQFQKLELSENTKNELFLKSNKSKQKTIQKLSPQQILAQQQAQLQVQQRHLLPEAKKKANEIFENLLGNYAITTATTENSAKNSVVLDKNAFFRYLTDPELNPALDPIETERGHLCHDMSLPLTNYFISTSAKTFLRYKNLLSASAGDGGGDGRSATTTTRDPRFMRAICDVSMYKKALIDGVRCIEIELWDNSSDTKPIVCYNSGFTSSSNSSSKSSSAAAANNNANNTNENSFSNQLSTATNDILSAASGGIINNDNSNNNNNSGGGGIVINSSRLQLDEVLSIIQHNAFASSSFPLLINLTIHVTQQQQQLYISQALRKHFGPQLVKPTWRAGDAPNNDTDFSPDGLMNKILLLSKRSDFGGNIRDVQRAEALDARTIVNKYHTPSYVGQTFDSRRNQQRAKSGNELPNLIPQLADLIFFDTFGGIVDMTKPAPPNCYKYHCSCFEEQKALGYTAKYEQQCISASNIQLMCVTPERPRFATGSNCSPQPFWNCGSQIVGLNWEDSSYEARLYKNRFSLVNGGSGLMLKPKYLRYENNNNSKNSKSKNKNFDDDDIFNNENENNNNNTQSKLVIGSHRLRIEFLSALSLPTSCISSTSSSTSNDLYNTNKTQTSTSKNQENNKTRLIRDPYLFVNVEGPYLESQSTERKLTCYTPVPNVDAEDAVFAAQLRFANRLSHGVSTENTLHACYSSSVSSTNTNNTNISPTNKNATSSSSSSSKSKRSNTNNYENYSASDNNNNNVLDLNVVVPDMSTIVIQVLDSSSQTITTPAEILYQQEMEAKRRKQKLLQEKQQQHSNIFGISSSTKNDNINSASSQSQQQQQQTTNRPIKQTSDRVLIAEAMLPVHLLQQGIRCVSLYDPLTLEPIPDAQLMVHISKGETNFVSREFLAMDNVVALDMKMGQVEQQEIDHEALEFEKMLMGETSALNSTTTTATSSSTDRRTDSLFSDASAVASRSQSINNSSMTLSTTRGPSAVAAAAASLISTNTTNTNNNNESAAASSTTTKSQQQQSNNHTSSNRKEAVLDVTLSEDTWGNELQAAMAEVTKQQQQQHQNENDDEDDDDEFELDGTLANLVLGETTTTNGDDNDINNNNNNTLGSTFSPEAIAAALSGGDKHNNKKKEEEFDFLSSSKYASPKQEFKYDL